MPARAVASASVSFGLVTIPVKLFPATQTSSGVAFHMLHKACGTRVRQQYTCPRDEVVVPRDEMVKGYEFAKDQYVTFTTDELKALEEKATQTVEIAEFVPLDKVDPVYFDKPYYLAPDRGGEKAYHLLAEVMRRTQRCALAKYAARGKQYLVLVRPVERGLVLQQLLYADEVRSFSEVGLPDTPSLREPELKLAEQIVEQISRESFNPAPYEDEVKKRILTDIQRKIDGQEIEAPAPMEAPAQIIDLMEALKASLGAKAAKGSGAPGDAGRRPARAAPEKSERAATRRPERRSARK